MNSIIDNKEFWRINRPFLSDKVTAQTNTISLVRVNFIRVNFFRMRQRFQKHSLTFSKNAVIKLCINRYDAKFNGESVLSTNPVDIATQKF